MQISRHSQGEVRGWQRESALKSARQLQRGLHEQWRGKFATRYISAMSDPSPYSISTDQTRLDAALVHRYLSKDSYWARGVPLEVVQRALRNSLCFGLYHRDLQVGFARVVTDGATFGYLADVFIVPGHRGLGLGKQLIAAVMAHPDLQGLRRFMLATRDAHGLYRQFGFAEPKNPQLLMERHDPDVYQQSGER
jgi:GNAT superfamily N-acetyltransferase